MSNSIPIRYFVTNYFQGKIFVFNEEWNYVSEKASFTTAYIIIIVGNNFYITGTQNIWKTDEQLNKLITYTNSTCDYTGIYYSSSNNSIYVTSNNLQAIHIFNLYLALTDTISTSPFNPWSINGFNNQLYVGTGDGKVLVIENKKIIKQFNACYGQSRFLLYISFDEFNNMATACENNQVYLYNTNGTYLNKNIPTVSWPGYIGFDSKTRLVVVGSSRISIYNIT